MHHADSVSDPLRLIQDWLDDARAILTDPGAMTLATSTPAGRPSARIVLLRGVDERGLVFFTNRESRKGEELRANPYAALVLHWWELGRQIRVEGRVDEVSDAESDAYWSTRPRGSQIAAWASRQSRPLTDRAELEARVGEATARFGEIPVPRPSFWGGYRVLPDAVELWEHRDDRLHDRVRYTRERDGWRVERLAP